MKQPKDAQALLEDNQRLRDALQDLLNGMEQMPQFNEEIAEQVMRGDHSLECEIGGDEATISSWVGIARMALLSNDKTQLQPPQPNDQADRPAGRNSKTV